MKKDGFFYKVLLGVCIALCVTAIVGGVTAAGNGLNKWITELQERASEESSEAELSEIPEVNSADSVETESE